MKNFKFSYLIFLNVLIFSCAATNQIIIIDENSPMEHNVTINFPWNLYANEFYKYNSIELIFKNKNEMMRKQITLIVPEGHYSINGNIFYQNSHGFTPYILNFEFNAEKKYTFQVRLKKITVISFKREFEYDVYIDLYDTTKKKTLLKEYFIRKITFIS